ncbi:MAG: type II toxin-antitoxin system VapC family toxin [Hyphomicrobiales bacterium]
MDRLLGRRIYLDANVFIYAFEDYPAYHDDCAAILDAVDGGQFEGVASELVFLEILPKPFLTDVALAERYVDTLESVEALFLVPVTRSIALRAAVIRAETRSAAPDAIHLSTAIETGCDGFVTNDRSIRSPVLEVIRLDPR